MAAFPSTRATRPFVLGAPLVEVVEVEEVEEVEERRCERRSAWRLAFSALCCCSAVQEGSYLPAAS